MVKVNRWSDQDGAPCYEISGMTEQEFLSLRDLMAWAISEKQRGAVSDEVRTAIWDLTNQVYDTWETEEWDNERIEGNFYRDTPMYEDHDDNPLEDE